MSKLYDSLTFNMSERLKNLSLNYNYNLENIIESYNRRKSLIEKCYSNDYKNRESRILYYAYKGVERDLKEGVKNDKNN